MSDLRELPNPLVVTIALASLGGASRRVYTEEIAERARELAPEKFSWRMQKYRELGWPDKFAVKCALEDAQKEKNGHLVSGKCDADLAKDGWRLTAAGAGKAKPYLAEIGKLDTRERVMSTRSDARRIRKRVQSHAIYGTYKRTGSLAAASEYDFRELLSCSADASAEMLASSFERLRATVELAGDTELMGFLGECEAAFGTLMGFTESDTNAGGKDA